MLLLSQCTTQRSFVGTKPDYSKYPNWVKSMDNPNVNYFDACKQFDKYWSTHFANTNNEEDYDFDNADKDSEKDPRPFYMKVLQSEKKAKERSNELNIEKKKFEKWKLENLPYVKEDGSLMTPEERIEAWKQLNNM